MTNANKKRFRRGDPLVFKEKPTNLTNVRMYQIKGQKEVYSLSNSKPLSEKTIKNMKRIYLKAGELLTAFASLRSGSFLVNISNETSLPKLYMLCF